MSLRSGLTVPLTSLPVTSLMVSCINEKQLQTTLKHVCQKSITWVTSQSHCFPWHFTTFILLLYILCIFILFLRHMETDSILRRHIWNKSPHIFCDQNSTFFVLPWHRRVPGIAGADSSQSEYFNSASPNIIIWLYTLVFS